MNQISETTAVAPAVNEHDAEQVYAYSIGTYSVLRVLPNEPFTRKLFPKLVERAISFIEREQSDVDPIWLGNLLYSNFNQNTNLIHLLVAIDANEKIVAHCITYVENIQKLGYHAHILQVCKDEGGPEIIELGNKLIDEWAKSLNLKTILNSSHSQSRARLFNRYGFEPYRWITRKNLVEGGQ